MLDLPASRLYNGSMKTTGNTKALGVPSEVHAQAVALAKRDGVKVYELVALALDLYDRINSPRNGSDQDGAQ